MSFQKLRVGGAQALHDHLGRAPLSERAGQREREMPTSAPQEGGLARAATKPFTPYTSWGHTPSPEAESRSVFAGSPRRGSPPRSRRSSPGSSPQRSPPRSPPAQHLGKTAARHNGAALLARAAEQPGGTDVLVHAATVDTKGSLHHSSPMIRSPARSASTPPFAQPIFAEHESGRDDSVPEEANLAVRVQINVDDTATRRALLALELVDSRAEDKAERVDDHDAATTPLPPPSWPSSSHPHDAEDDESDFLSPFSLPPPPPASHRGTLLTPVASLRHFEPLDFSPRLAASIGLDELLATTSISPRAMKQQQQKRKGPIRASKSASTLPPLARPPEGGLMAPPGDGDEAKQVALNRYLFHSRVTELRLKPRMFFFKEMGGLEHRRRTGHGVSVGVSHLSEEQLVANVMAAHDRERGAQRIKIERDVHGKLVTRFVQGKAGPGAGGAR